MSIGLVGTRISTGNGPTGNTLCFLKNWKSGSATRAYAARVPSLPWIHDRVHLQHQLPVASIIRQLSLAPSLPSQRATVASSDKAQSRDKSQGKGKRDKVELRLRWTMEEDIALYSYLQENQQIGDIYDKFPWRSRNSVACRAWVIRKACFVPPEKGGLVEDPNMSVAQRVAILRQLFRKQTLEESREDGSYTARMKSTYMKYTSKISRRPFSEEEKEMLTKLVHKYRDKPNTWAMVSGGSLVDEEGAPRLNRSASACKRVWETMNENEPVVVGRWDKSEQQRLVKAIRSQVGDEYDICLDAKEEGPERSNQSATATSESDAELILKMRSRVLRDLNWEKVASEVRTRSARQCRGRFYWSMHTGKAGRWTATETERLVKGYKLYGPQWDKIAAHIGTRSFAQAFIKHKHMEKIAKESNI